MSQKLKIIAYAVLLGFAAWFGYGFFTNMTAADAMKPGTPDPNNQVPAPRPPPTNEEEVVTGAVTNGAADSALNTNGLSPSPKTKSTMPAPLSRGQRTSSAM